VEQSERSIAENWKNKSKIAPVEPGFAVCALCCFLVRRQ
jgi:hypothetical protein